MNLSEESTLNNTFKFYDLADTGFCNRSQWVKALAKIGLSGFSEKDLSLFFDFYDTDAKGYIEYKQFTAYLFSPRVPQKEGSYTLNNLNNPNNLNKSSNLNENKQITTEEPKIEEIISRLNSKLAARGVKGILSISRAFKIMDHRGKGVIDFSDFQRGLRDYELNLNTKEVTKLFNYFDRNGSAVIDYEEFLRRVRGDMNNFRKNLVSQAFSILDLNGNGHIDLEDLRRIYSTQKHPDVLQGKRSSDEVLIDFLQTFDTHHSLLKKKSNTSRVTREDFMDYYENVSMSIDDDSYFEAMMTNCWKLNRNLGRSGNTQINREAANNNFSNMNSFSFNPHSDVPKLNQNTEIEIDINSLMEKFRTCLNKRGASSYVGLQREFKIFDHIKSDGKVDYEEFSVTLIKFGLGFNKTELKAIFDYFDRDRSGYIDYTEFLLGVRGRMNERRRKLVQAVFEKIDKDRDGVLTLQEIQSTFDCKNHPDVLNGKKGESEVFKDFLSCFESPYRVDKEIKLSLNEFLSYYDNVSASIDTDQYFELIISNSWKFNQESNNYNNYSNKNRREVSNNSLETKPLYNINTNSSINLLNNNYPRNAIPLKTSQPRQVGSTSSVSYLSPLEAVNRFRQKLAARGTKGILSLNRMFQLCDEDGSGVLSLGDFSNAIKDYRLGFNQDEINQIFSVFDRNGTSSINYKDFLRNVVGEMNNNRRNLVRRVFQMLDKFQKGAVELSDVKGLYNAKRHPEVISGKRTEDEVLGDWIDNLHHFSFLKGKSRNGVLTLEEFMDYYNNVSMSIDEDRYFELMMNNCWNLDGRRNLSSVGQNLIKSY